MELREKYDSLTNESSVKELQEYVRQMIITRGFDNEDIKDLMILLTEETGELAKAIRKTIGLKLDVAKDNDKYDVRGEIADVFNYLLCMCCTLDVDLIDCWRQKEAKNFERNWN